MDVFFKKSLPYFLVFLVWSTVYFLHFQPTYLIPSPIDAIQSLGDGIQNRTLLIGAGKSLMRILIGYFISLVIGIPLGLAVGRSRFLDDTLGSFMGTLQVIPSICWLPFAILWFGLSEWAIQFVIIMGGFLPIAIATIGGIQNIPSLYVRAARTMGIRRFDLYRRVVLPAALPSILTGMKLGWSFAWRSLMAGELLFVSVGLGQLLQTGRELNDMSQVIAVMFMIMLIGWSFDHLFGFLQHRLRRKWGTA